MSGATEEALLERSRVDPAGREERTALEMIAACFRHQHPEAFGRPPVPGAVLPISVRYGRDDLRPSPPRRALYEAPMGHPRAAAQPPEPVLP